MNANIVDDFLKLLKASDSIADEVAQAMAPVLKTPAFESALDNALHHADLSNINNTVEELQKEIIRLGEEAGVTTRILNNFSGTSYATTLKMNINQTRFTDDILAQIDSGTVVNVERTNAKYNNISIDMLRAAQELADKANNTARKANDAPAAATENAARNTNDAAPAADNTTSNTNNAGGTTATPEPTPAPNTASNNGAGATGRAAQDANKTYDDFPEFAPKLDGFKIAAHFDVTGGWLPLPKPVIFPVAAMRPRSFGIVNPVLDYVSKKMGDAGMIDGLRDLEKNVIAAHKAGEQGATNPADVINAFAKANKANLEELSDNIAALKEYVKKEYKTNGEMSGKAIDPETGKSIPGKDITRYSADLFEHQKEALVAYLDHMEKLSLDISKGTDGKNGQEILENLEKVKNGHLNLDKVEKSVTGLSRSAELANYEHIKITGEWLDKSDVASRPYLEKLERGINSGFYSAHSHDGAPKIWNMNTTENLEKSWQDFIGKYTELDSNGELVIKLAEDVKPLDDFVATFDTIIGAALPEQAILMAEQLTRILQTNLRGGNLTPFPLESDFLKKLKESHRYHVDANTGFLLNPTRTTDAYDRIMAVFKHGTDEKPGAPNKRLLAGIKEGLFEVNRYTVTKAEQQTDFLETAIQYGNKDSFFGTGIGYPAEILIRSRAFNDLIYRPLTFMTGGHRVIPETQYMGKVKPNYYAASSEWRGLKNPADPNSGQESMLNVVGRAASRLSTGFLFDNVQFSRDFKFIPVRGDLTTLGKGTAAAGLLSTVAWASDKYEWNETAGEYANYASNIGEAGWDIGTMFATVPYSLLEEGVHNLIGSDLGHDITDGLTKTANINSDLTEIEDVRDASEDLLDASEDAVEAAKDAIKKISGQGLIIDNLIHMAGLENQDAEVARLTQVKAEIPQRLNAANIALSNVESIQADIAEKHEKIENLPKKFGVFDDEAYLGYAQALYADELLAMESMKANLAGIGKIRDAIEDQKTLTESPSPIVVPIADAERLAEEAKVAEIARIAEETRIAAEATAAALALQNAQDALAANPADPALQAAVTEKQEQLGTLTGVTADTTTTVTEKPPAPTAAEIEAAARARDPHLYDEHKGAKDALTTAASANKDIAALYGSDTTEKSAAYLVAGMKTQQADKIVTLSEELSDKGDHNAVAGLNELLANVNGNNRAAEDILAQLNANQVRATALHTEADALNTQIQGITALSGKDDAQLLLATLKGKTGDIETVKTESQDLHKQIYDLVTDNATLIQRNPDAKHHFGTGGTFQKGAIAAGGGEYGLLNQFLGSEAGGTSVVGGYFNMAASKVRDGMDWWGDAKRGAKTQGERNAYNLAEQGFLGFLSIVALNKIGTMTGMSKGVKIALLVGIIGYFVNRSGKTGQDMHDTAENRSPFAQANPSIRGRNSNLPKTAMNRATNGKNVEDNVVGIRDVNGKEVAHNLPSAQQIDITRQAQKGGVPQQGGKVMEFDIERAKMGSEGYVSNIQGSGNNIITFEDRLNIHNRIENGDAQINQISAEMVQFSDMGDAKNDFSAQSVA
ncbi:MAG: hypothetical protein COB14_06600 [Alphaproteobacteria bacterium]|nr:MAG: hypothetical protein COB14_06600 [Alphaproteobacteria bacterium]